MVQSIQENMSGVFENAHPDLMRELFARFPSGVAAICIERDGEPDGFAVSSFAAGISLEPPIVLFSAMKESRTWGRLRQHDRVGVSILGVEQSLVCRRLAAREGDRFRDVRTETGEHGALFIAEAPVHFECSVHAEIEAGDHVLVLLQVHRGRFHADGSPLLYHLSKFHRLLAA